jgi:hypothetical protein
VSLTLLSAASAEATTTAEPSMELSASAKIVQPKKITEIGRMVRNERGGSSLNQR